MQTIDIEANEQELQELCEYYDYNMDKVTILMSDEIYLKALVDDELIRHLTSDNIAYWNDGDLL